MSRRLPPPKPPSDESVRGDVLAALKAFGLPEHYGMTAEDRVLKAMRELTVELQRPPESREVAARAGIAGGNMSGIIRRLYDRGDIIRLPMGDGSVRARWIPAAR